MGTCNVDIEDHAKPDGNLALTHNLPAGEKSNRVYDWYTREQVRGAGLLRVPWAGTPFAILRRDVVEQLEFAGDLRWNPDKKHAYAYDIGIAHDLAKMNVPLLVDTDVYFWHNRLNDKRLHLMNGRKPRQTWYDVPGQMRTVTML
jgi:hypothetical protein